MRKFIVRGDLAEDPALTIEKQLLLSPGIYKGQTITASAIKHGIKGTPWADKANRAVIYGHRTHTEKVKVGDPSPDDWLGYHSEPQYLTLSDGVSVEGMYADIFLFDDALAKKIAYGGVRCGMSAGMRFNYRTSEIEYFTNQSVVDNPADKNAFLNLSDSEQIMDVIEPTFLTLSDDKQKDERGSDIMTIENEEKIKKLEDAVATLEKDKAEAEKIKAEADAKAAEEVKVNEAKEAEKVKVEADAKAAEEIKIKEAEETKAKAKAEPAKESKPEPKEIEKPAADNTAVVNAVNNMTEKLTEEFKKAATSATVAATNPAATQISSEDETTKNLVEQYKTLHPELE